jgi:hypothetical protein
MFLEKYPRIYQQKFGNIITSNKVAQIAGVEVDLLFFMKSKKFKNSIILFLFFVQLILTIEADIVFFLWLYMLKMPKKSRKNYKNPA